MGTTTIRMVRAATRIDNVPGTSSMAMSRTFHCHHREKASEGSVQSPHWDHTGSHCIDAPPDMGSYIQ
jgi:hypothetical protein